MELTNEQRKVRAKSIQHASMAALRAHFTGAGAATRRWHFFRSGLLNSAGWMGRFLCLGSWAVIAGLLAGPEHDFFLKQVYAWMVAMPVDQVLMETHALFLSAAFECVKFGLLVGFGQKLFQIAKLAGDAAKEQYVPT